MLRISFRFWAVMVVFPAFFTVTFADLPVTFFTVAIFLFFDFHVTLPEAPETLSVTVFPTYTVAFVLLSFSLGAACAVDGRTANINRMANIIGTIFLAAYFAISVLPPIIQSIFHFIHFSSFCQVLQTFHHFLMLLLLFVPLHAPYNFWAFPLTFTLL